MSQRPIRPCANCGHIKPISGRNLCTACYDYQRQRGEARPAHLWGRCYARPETACDCGRPITRTIKVRQRRGQATLRLCEACYRLELEQAEQWQRWGWTGGLRAQTLGGY